MTDQGQPAEVIAARLRKCREDKGWTLVQASERLSEESGETVTHLRWALWEHGDRLPSSELVAPLATLFGTDPGYFAAQAE
jgi:transcriptional regulator with XRE-family HTH domain